MQRRTAAIRTLIAAAAALHASPALASPWGYGRAWVEPEARFVVRDSYPADGTFDTISASSFIIRSESQVAVSCIEVDVEHIRATEGFWWDVGGSLTVSGGEAPMRVRIELYEADGIASLTDATVTGEEVAIVTVYTQYWTPLANDIAGPLSRMIEAGATHIGVRLSCVDVSRTRLNQYIGISVTQRCSPCVFDYDGNREVENGEDIMAFLLDWGRGHPCADADGSGLVDAQDYWYWFERWGRMDCY